MLPTSTCRAGWEGAEKVILICGSGRARARRVSLAPYARHHLSSVHAGAAHLEKRTRV